MREAEERMAMSADESREVGPVEAPAGAARYRRGRGAGPRQDALMDELRVADEEDDPGKKRRLIKKELKNVLGDGQGLPEGRVVRVEHVDKTQAIITYFTASGEERTISVPRKQYDSQTAATTKATTKGME